jgi:hypothetical protein
MRSSLQQENGFWYGTTRARSLSDESCGRTGSGPYKVEVKLSPGSYILRAEGDERVARVHVNRMRRWTSRAEENVRDPSAGIWPDSRRVLRSIMGRREENGGVEFQVPRAGRRGYVWVP